MCGDHVIAEQNEYNAITSEPNKPSSDSTWECSIFPVTLSTKL